MKNPNLSEVVKIEKCECEEVCESCLEKYAHTFDAAVQNHTGISGDVIAEIVLSPKTIDSKKEAILLKINELKLLIATLENSINKF